MPEDKSRKRAGIWIDEHIERSTPRIAGDEVRILSGEDAQDEDDVPVARTAVPPAPPSGQQRESGA